MPSGDQQNDGFETFDDAAFDEAEHIPTEDTLGDEEPVSAEMTGSEEPAAVADDMPESPSEKEETKQGMMASLTDVSPYTVMLCISLVAVFVCIFILWGELADYEYDRKAKDIPIITQSIEFDHADARLV